MLIGLISDTHIPDRAKEIPEKVFEALKEKGYDPIAQIVGYILSGDPTYITAHKGARNLITRIDREDLLNDVFKVYFSGDEENDKSGTE